MSNYAPGVRISVRGEDFLIQKVNEGEKENKILEVQGISELVKDKKFVFDTRLEFDIELIKPENTTLLVDNETAYRKTKLYIETVIRNSCFFSNKIEIGNKAAINLSKYQYDPTLKALKLPRPRILCADTVGLGKTIEVGIFLAEMIKRGKGQRILVVALKSILAQFQQEIWSRFAIPLVRLDTLGIVKIKADLPSNKNPFDYYDKTIVSIDTLKNNARFRYYLEKTTWDIVVIDECHTVANSSSQRGDLAEFLATRCESLMLTSATPHNGKKENFGNLIRMLEPTAIQQNNNFTKDDILRYYVRRFKHNIGNEVKDNFTEREIIKLSCKLNVLEEEFLFKQQSMKEQALSENKNPRQNYDLLFSINLFKSYFSSPQACLESLKRRIEKVKAKEFNENIAANNLVFLNELVELLNEIISTGNDSKYNRFVKELNLMKWSGKQHNERIIVFSERIETLKALQTKLLLDFNLTENQIAFFHGALTDLEQQQIIENFGKEDSEIKVLLTSDAGSQGVNLHYFCNRMFNYDVPWSIITLDQRNGRIDRYGQHKTPYIYYLIGESETKGLKTDLHIIDKLIEKENQVHNTLGDATSVYKLYDPEKEAVEIIQTAIITGNESIVDGNNANDSENIDWGAAWEDDISDSYVEETPENKHISFYASDFDYYQSLAEFLQSKNSIYKENIIVDTDSKLIEICQGKHFYKELNDVLYDIPQEAFPDKDKNFILSANTADVQKSIEKARKKKNEWASIQVLYDLHPLVKWMMNKFLANVDKAVAMVAKISTIPQNTYWFVFHGLVSNNLGQSVISDFFVIGLSEDAGLIGKPLAFDDFVHKFKLTDKHYTQEISENEINTVENLKIDAIESATEFHMIPLQNKLLDSLEYKLEEYSQKLNEWYNLSKDSLETEITDAPDTIVLKRQQKFKETGLRQIETIKSEKSQFYKNMTSLDKEPFLKLLAVFFNT